MAVIPGPNPGSSRGSGEKARTEAGVTVDSVDKALLDQLQGDGRLSMAELGRRIGLSPSAVAERLSRLERRGVVRGYRAVVDPRALGFTLSAVIRVRPAPRQLHKVAELTKRLEEVSECHRITGEDCYLLTAHLRDVGHLEELVDQLAPYGQTTTSIVQSSPVEWRGVPTGQD
jgi:Lrp/AsnC family leucine-responsive transcriptional regulator